MWRRIWVLRDRSRVRSWRVRQVCGCSGSQELETRACGAAAGRETNTLLLGKKWVCDLTKQVPFKREDFHDFHELSVTQRWLSGWANGPRESGWSWSRGRNCCYSMFFRGIRLAHGAACAAATAIWTGWLLENEPSAGSHRPPRWRRRWKVKVEVQKRWTRKRWRRRRWKCVAPRRRASRLQQYLYHEPCKSSSFLISRDGASQENRVDLPD